MTILHVSDHYLPAINGCTYHITSIKKEQERRGHNVYVLCISYGKPEPSDDEHIFRLPSIANPLRTVDRVIVPFSPGIETKLAQLPIDVIHNHLFTTGFIGMRLAKKKHVPIVATVHTTNELYLEWMIGPAARYFRPLTDGLTRWYYNKHDAAIAPSTKAKQVLERSGVKRPIALIHNGIDLSLFYDAKAGPFLAKYPILKGKRFMTLVSRVDKGRNIEMAVEAMRLVANQTPDVRLVMIGDGNARAAVEAKVKELKLQENIIMTGYLTRETIASAHKGSVLSLVPSSTAILPTVAIEAAACGKPIVAVDDIANVDVVQQGKNGVMTKEDPEDYAKGILDLLSNSAKQKQYGEAGITVTKVFSVGSNVDDLEKLYQEMMATRRNHLS